MLSEKFYITTAISYVNGAPHIGHALEFVQADVLARYARLRGVDTYFLTGTDEHGLKIYEKAQEEGKNVQDFVDENAALFKKMASDLKLSNDGFVRTSSDLHKKGAQKMWQMMAAKGDIYKDVYKGNYCVGCESFIPDKDLDENGHCPIHKKPLRYLEEENYFFKLSQYSDKIKELIASDQLKIVPESRKKEMLNIIGEDGLHDVSFSRPQKLLPWGVPVPDDPEQVMYVWCDALSNYLTYLGFAEDDERYRRYWPADVHLIGKDILRFHAGIWIGMLLSAELPLPREIYVHGFITSEGQKMSKSLGNVVDPQHYLERYGVDVLRYFLIREIPSTDDGDFSEGRFLEVHNSELANGVGNLLNRVVMMTERYLDGVVPEMETEGVILETNIAQLFGDYCEKIEAFALKEACDVLMKVVDKANKYIDETKPWAMAKEGDEQLATVLYNLLQTLYFIGAMLWPLIPETAEKFFAQLGVDGATVDYQLQWGALAGGQKVNKEDPLFPRLEG